MSEFLQLDLTKFEYLQLDLTQGRREVNLWLSPDKDLTIPPSRYILWIVCTPVLSPLFLVHYNFLLFWNSFPFSLGYDEL